MHSLTTAATGSAVTEEQFDEALQEARDLGYVRSEVVNRDGSLTTSIDFGDGFSLDVVRDDERESRLGAGKDSAGTFCIVAGAIITAATVAMQGNGGIRCGTKALRVYPFVSQKPRCA